MMLTKQESSRVRSTIVDHSIVCFGQFGRKDEDLECDQLLLAKLHL